MLEKRSYLQNWQAITCACIVLAAILFKLWLIQGLSLVARNYFFDDILYLDHAYSLINGLWLGKFNYLTLAKGPGYPLWLAFNFFSSLPLLFSQHIVYISAIALFILAIRPFVKSRFLLLIFFITLLFDPQSSSPRLLQVVREGIYSSQMIAVLACAIGILAYRNKAKKHLLGWSIALGCWLPFFQITREEGILLLPALALILLYTSWDLWRSKVKQYGQKIVIISIAIILSFCITKVIRLVNFHYYGVPVIVEQYSPQFKAMNRAIGRVKPQHWNRYIPLPSEARKRIYEISPSFAELKPFLEGESGRSWTDMSVARLPELQNERDIGGGWYLWALRDAVNLAGHYQTGPDTMRYFQQIATEVNRACDTGKITCYPDKKTRIQANFFRLIPYTYQSIRKLSTTLLDYSQNRPSQPVSVISIQEYKLFADITSNKITPPAGQVLPTANQNRYNKMKIKILANFYMVFKHIPIVWALGSTLLLISLLISCYLRKLPPLLVITTAISLAILFRLAGLAYIDATACSAAAYLGPIYPLSTIFSFCSFFLIWEVRQCLKSVNYG